jgi:plastocyanin
MMIGRRTLLATGGLWLAGLAQAHGGAIDIAMNSNEDGSKVWYDAIGLLVQPGTTLRWMIMANVHSVAAYHPDNDNHSLRIPEKAKPWNSDFLVNPGDHFEVTLTEPGVYDYFCAPHEQAGMVGRIVVASASGPGTLPFDYFKSMTPRPDWQDVPEAAQKNFPSIEKILQDGFVRMQI